MDRWLLETWYGGSRRGAWLLPFAWLFALAAWIRRWCYRLGLFRVRRAGKPVIVVGNITVGGTGKTPLTLWLAQRLAARGLTVGIVSRGYRGAGGGARLVPPDADPADSGDEPALMASRGIARVAVAADRTAAAALLAPDCDVLLADDGLQHYALAREAEVAVVDGVRGLGNGWRLPAGPLREAASRLDQVDVVVVSGEGTAIGGACRMRIEPVAVVGLADGSRRAVESLGGQRVHAVAAIGHPGRFFDLLRQCGATVIEHPLPDHHPLAAGDIRFGDGLPVLMTEKDAVKCRRFAGHEHAYLEVRAAFADADAARLDEMLDHALARAAVA